MNSDEGLQRIQEEVANLIRRVERQVGGFAYGWKAAIGANDFMSSESLADLCLIKFIDLIERDIKGQVEREPFS